MKKLLLVIPVALLLAAGCNAQNKATDKTASTTTQQAAPNTQTGQNVNQIPARGSVQNQTQCAADGKVFFQTHWSKSDPLNSSAWTYDGPEYHSSQKLNTCLVYVGETSPFNGATFSTYHNLYIYDIYSNQNKPILQSETDRTCPTGGQCTETLNANAFSDIPNLSTNDFGSQKNILFSQ